MRRKYKELAEKYGTEFGVNPMLIEAVIIAESGQVKWASRYEKNWRWFLTPIKYAKMVRSSNKTERIHQATSWGLMQVMGTVARELGFKGHLPQLCDPHRGIYYGAMKLGILLKKHKIAPLALAAYNAGNPRSKAGAKYADKVIGIFDNIVSQA